MTKKLVYVADDDPAAVKLMRAGLEEAGYDVVAALDGPSLLREVEKRRPDLVLLDITMPNLSGWEVRAKLEKDAATRAIPVIAVTAFGGPTFKASEMAALGFADYLHKPFPMPELARRVEAAMDRARASAVSQGRRPQGAAGGTAR